jgi:iron complex transport system ATP-binding protein
MAARYSDLLYAVKDCTICSGGRPCDMITKPELARVFQIDAEIVHDARNHCPYFIPIKTKNTLQGEVIYETH